MDDLSVSFSKGVVLLDSTEYNNTVVSLIEKAFANDITEYFDGFDKRFGFSYLPLDKVRVVTSEGVIDLNRSTRDVDWNLDADSVFALRYIGGESVRTVVWDDSLLSNLDKVSSEVGIPDYSKYSEVFPLENWLRLEMYVNRVLGFDYMKVSRHGDSHKLEFTKNCSKCSLIFLIVSELIMSDKNKKVFLATEFSMLKEDSSLRDNFANFLISENISSLITL